MSLTCDYVTGGTRCDRLAMSAIDGRKFCWQCALLYRHEKMARVTRDLFNEILNNPGVTLPDVLKSKVKTHTGLLSYLLEHGPT